jgi:ABC-type dipeptide/oligopeptide/nickel transport system permease subunit
MLADTGAVRRGVSLDTRRKVWGSFYRFMRSSHLGAISTVLLVLIGAIAIFANQIAPWDPLDPDFKNMRVAPFNAGHLLGTDLLGRDILSRIIHGTRITLLVAFVSVFIGDAIGFTWGIVSGYLGGRFDMLSQRVVDVLMSFPGIILALMLLAVVGSGLTPVIIAIAVTRIPGSTRVIRSTVLSVKEATYVEAARAIGVSQWRIMARHVAPQCIAPLLVIFSASLGGAIFAEASLSFLGLGIPPPNPSWGSMLSGTIAEAFNPPWWLVWFPGMAITFTILAFNLVGDALRDHLDPKLRGKLE